MLATVGIYSHNDFIRRLWICPGSLVNDTTHQPSHSPGVLQSTVRTHTRPSMERTIGNLKGCWMCLDAVGGQLLYKPEKAHKTRLLLSNIVHKVDRSIILDVMLRLIKKRSYILTRSEPGERNLQKEETDEHILTLE